MDRWCGKVAIVTGASSGIGEAIALALVEAGMRVVGMARRLDRMQKIAEGLTKAKGSFYPIRADVTREEDILEAFRFAETMGGVDVLVNNAGVVFPETIIDGTTDKFRNVLDVNVLCTVICIREATRSMRKRRAEGHIININSIVGHDANKGNAPLSLYQASKYAVTAISEVVRNELAVVKAPIRVTNLSPGVVNTDMVKFASRNERIFDVLPYIETKDVANSVLYALGTPANVQVTELTVTTLH